MIESMTGFGSASLLTDKFTIEVEIKSINSRFLDIAVRLPRSLNSKEIEIRNIRLISKSRILSVEEKQIQDLIII